MLTHRLLAVFTACALVFAPASAFADELIPSLNPLPLSSSPTTEEPVPVDPFDSEQPNLVLESPTTTSSLIDAPPPDLSTLTTPSSTEVMNLVDVPTSTTTSLSTSTPALPIDTSSTNPPSIVYEHEPTLAHATSTICLAMIAPYPLEGSEWVAFYGLTPSSSHRLLGWSLHDAQSSLVKITTSTALLWDETSLTLRFHLKSSRLNNDGDTVTLRTELNDSHDTFTYTEVEKDQRWFRPDCASPWRIIPEPIITYTSPPAPPSTPAPDASPIMMQAPPPSMAVETAPLPSVTALVIEEDPPIATSPMTPITAPAPVTEHKPPPASISTSTAMLAAATSQQQTPETPSTTTKKTAKAAPKPSSTKQKTAAPAPKKTSSPKSTPKIATPTMSAILEQPASYQGVRVRLTGTVASTKKLIGAHSFVLMNTDGKGLLVQAKSTAPTPDRGQRIQITGVISWNDTGVWLKQQAQDSWSTLEEPNDDDAPSFALRTVALDAPGDEDAWSHIEIEGRVTDVQTASFDLETEDALPLRVRLPKSLGYRAGRLEEGDTVRVRGLLDIRGIEPLLLPQVVEDIQILSRAPLPTPQEPRPVQAPWLPVGVIAGTLAASETLRRAGSWYKKRQEERAFATFLQEKTA